MGANTSRHRYEYGYGDPVYDPYARARARNLAQAPPYYGPPVGMLQAGYPVVPPVVYPLIMQQPLQQVAGQPVVGQVQQPIMQMPEPQVQATGGNVPVVPQNLMPMPQQPIAQPQPQIPLTNGFQPVMPQGPIPQSFARVPSSSSSSHDSRRSRHRRRRRRRRSWERDPLESNPLPLPPRDVNAPDDILVGTAMTPRGPPLPRRSSPLRNPLPSPPRDVYTLRKYRPLLIGTAYADLEKEVYPKGWFSDEEGRDSDSGLGRIFERLNPFKPRESSFSPRHRRQETMPELSRLPEVVRESSGSGSDSSDAPQGGRRRGVGRSFSSRLPFSRRWRRGDPVIPQPVADPLPRVAEGPEPPVGFMAVSSPAVPGPTVQPQPAHPLSPLQAGPQPAHPLSPAPPEPQPVISPNPNAMPEPVIPRSPNIMPQPGDPFTPGLQPQTPFEMPRSPGPHQSQPVHPLTPGPPQQMMMPTPGQPQSMVMLSPAMPQGMPMHSPASQRVPMPTPGVQPMAMPSPNLRPPTGMHTPGSSQPMGMPTPARRLSPVIPSLVAGEGPVPVRFNSDDTLPVIHFDKDTLGYGGLCHLSPHSVHYRNKLYPTAAHLFEAFRFLGRRNDLASRVRKAKTFDELIDVLKSIEQHTRPDWEEILLDKMEEAVYFKTVQHEDLCNMLLDTGNVELIYADPNDPFWGENDDGEGANELGRALMRVRDRLRREADAS